MATANFKFEHRCVVVTDDDLEDGNVPSIRDTIEYGLSFYTNRLDEKRNYILAAEDSRGSAIDLPEPSLKFYGVTFDQIKHVARGVVIGLRIKYKKPCVMIRDLDTCQSYGRIY